MERLRVRPRARGSRRAEAGRAAAHTKYAPSATTASTSCSTRGDASLWWVDAEREGLLDVSGLETEALYGWFDRRPFDDSSREFVWVAVSRRVTLYDRIASFYDPWSRSVTEDVGFYVDEALASGGPVVELAVGTGRSRCPSPEAGIDVIGVDSSPAMLAVARAAADERRRLRAARPPPRRPARATVDRACPARHLPVPLAPAHGDRGGEAPRAARGARLLEPDGTIRLRRLRAEPRGHRGDGRALARARARDLRARRLGRGARTLTLSVRSTTAARSASTGSPRPSGSACSTAELDVDAVYGWFDAAHEGDEDMVFVTRSR